MADTMVDPPSGWKFGFPKKLMQEEREELNFTINSWLLKNGYPQYEIDYWKGSVPCRWWNCE